MPAQTKSRSTAARKPKSASKSTKKSIPAKPPVEKNLAEVVYGQATDVAKAVLNIPVGVVLVTGEDIAELVTNAITPFRERTTAEKEIKQYRTQLRRELNKFERRGHRATSRIRRQVSKSRTRFERNLRQNQTRVTKRVRPYRQRVEKKIRLGQGRFERNLGTIQSQVGEVIQDQAKRAQKLIDEVALQVQTLS